MSSMASISHIKVQLASGDVLELTLEDARSLHRALAELFDKQPSLPTVRWPTDPFPRYRSGEVMCSTFDGVSQVRGAADLGGWAVPGRSAVSSDA